MTELEQALRGRIPAHVGLVTSTGKHRGHPCVKYYLRDYFNDEHIFLGRVGLAKSGETTAELLAEIHEWRAKE